MTSAYDLTLIHLGTTFVASKSPFLEKLDFFVFYFFAVFSNTKTCCSFRDIPSHSNPNIKPISNQK
ncbi:hypothetical protein HanHA89_Chr04g0156571 [Helianthus annuus]|nr:hypothetical protein HanHA89_Chr04g0156571 [Helianthus annuus]